VNNYLAIILWIGSLIVQFIAYMIIAAKQRGRDESKMSEISGHGTRIGQLRMDLMRQRLMIENIATYLETKNGISFKRD